jgi:two-component system phosphate regulon sensor histidine kinase PhoR
MKQATKAAATLRTRSTLSDDPVVTQPTFPGLPQEMTESAADDETVRGADQSTDTPIDDGPGTDAVVSEHAPNVSPAEEALSTHDTAATDEVLSLFNVSSYLISVLDADELQRNVISSVAEALPTVHGGILWLFDAQKGRLRVASICNLPLEPQTRRELEQCQLRIGEGAAGSAVQRGEPRLIETRLGYRDSAPHLPPAAQLLFQQLNEQLPRQLSSLCIPLRVGTELIGALELLNFGRSFDQHEWRPLRVSDLPVLQIFANLAASALKNAQLYTESDRRRRRLTAFDAVVTAISTATDLDDLMRSVLDVVLSLTPGTCGALLLIDREHNRLVLGAQHGLTKTSISALDGVPLSAASCEEVVQYGQPMFRPLLVERNEGAFLEAGLEHCAYLPLLAGGTVGGVLALYGDSSLQLHADRQLLMPICNQVGFAIANVELYADSQSERRKLTTLINSITEGVVLCDGRGRLTLFNEAAQTLLQQDSLLFGLTLPEMRERFAIRDLDNQLLPVELLPMARALAGETFHDYRLIVCGASGPDTVMSFSGAPARADDGEIEGAVAVFRDITQQQKLERAKDDFLVVAAHELRSPLAAVRSYADLLLRREQQRSEADSRDVQGLTILTQQVSHMLRMVDNLLDLSRLDAGQLDLQPQRLNLVQLVDQVLDQQRPAAGGRNLQLESDADEIWLSCDPLRIRQVLTNLVNNAIKYGPNDREITVRLRSNLPEPFVDMEHSDVETATASGPFVQVTVSDRGTGITPDQQARLFQRFYRARSNRAEGLGLGLYLSRQFIHLHGGAIWVESREGLGTDFHFTLPI